MAEKIKICVVGLGEIGNNLLKALKKQDVVGVLDVKGVDIDPKKIPLARKTFSGYHFGKEMDHTAEFYFISVWTTEQVFAVLKTINKFRRANSVIVIESTLIPGTVKKIKKLYPLLPFVIFPHRYNGDDPEHHIFNLDRVMGGNMETAVSKVIDLFQGVGLMDINKIHITSPEIAELCKPFENAYRFAEIALAEQMRMMCEKEGINWDAARAAMNTKWNINVLEARDGIGKHCLPKDIKIINDTFPNDLFEACAKLDKKYIDWVKKKGKNK